MTILRSFAVGRNTVAAYLVCLGVLPAWGGAYVRVNQIGYVSGASKRALWHPESKLVPPSRF